MISAGLASFFQNGWLSASIVAFAGLVGGWLHAHYAPPQQYGHYGAAGLVAAIGVAIVLCILFVFSMFDAAARCFAPIQAPDKTVSFVENEKGCASEYRIRLYLVMKEWQTGIGAAIGLFGLAWAALYRSVYGDWKRFETPDFETFHSRYSDIYDRRGPK